VGGVDKIESFESDYNRANRGYSCRVVIISDEGKRSVEIFIEH